MYYVCHMWDSSCLPLLTWCVCCAIRFTYNLIPQCVSCVTGFTYIILFLKTKRLFGVDLYVRTRIFYINWILTQLFSLNKYLLSCVKLLEWHNYVYYSLDYWWLHPIFPLLHISMPLVCWTGQGLRDEVWVRIPDKGSRHVTCSFKWVLGLRCESCYIYMMQILSD